MGTACGTREMRNAYKISVGKPEEKIKRDEGKFGRIKLN
jgi:hypothetical protein